MPALDDFPPEQHLGRDLRIAYRMPGPGRIELTIPVVKELLRVDGTVKSEVLTTIIDETVGFAAVFEALPDWGSTAALSFGFTLEPVEPDGLLVVAGQVVKSGKRLIFVEGDVCWQGRLVAHGEGEFARVGRADRNADMDLPAADPDEVWEMGTPDSGLDRPYPERLGFEVVDGPGGVVEMPFDEYTRNSSGILHGGVVGALAIAAAEAAAEAPAVHAHVQYLSPGRTGPFRTGAAPRYQGAAGNVWRTETADVADARTMTRAIVTTLSEGMHA